MTTAWKVRIPTLLLWASLSLVGVYLVFVVGGFPGIYQVHWRLVTHAVTLVIVSGWLVAIVRRPELLVVPRLTIPCGAVLVAMVASTLLSRWPRFGWETALSSAGAALVFGVLVTVFAVPGLRVRLRFTAAALVVGVVLAYGVQLIALWLDFWQTVGHLTLPPLRPAYAGLIFGTPNIPAGVVLAFLPLVLAWIHGSSLPPMARRMSIGGLVVVGLFDLVVSGSRGGQLGFVAAGLVGGLLWALGRRRGDGSQAINLDRRRVLAGAAVLAVVAFAMVALSPRLLARLSDAGAGLRLTFWRESLAAFVDHPLAGTGPGTWAFAHWAYRDDVRPLDVVAHAHDAPIQLAAEMGLVGLVAGAIFVAGVVGLIAVAWRRQPGLEVIAIASGLAGLAAQSLVDNFSDLPLFVGGVAFLLAWLESGVGRRAFLAPARVRLGAGAAFALMAVVAMITVLPWDRAAAAYLDGVRAQDRGEWANAEAAYATALDLDAAYPLYRAAHGMAAAHTGDLATAASELQAGAALTDDPFMAIQAALALAGLGRDEDARAALDSATERGTVHRDLALNAGRTAEVLGQADQAARFYATAIATDPDLASSSYWRAPGRPLPAVDQFEAALARLAGLEGVDIDPSQAAVRIWALAGEAERARAAAASLPPGTSRDAAAAFVEAMAGDRLALERVRAMADADPLGPAVAGLATVANAVDDQSADRYRHWVSLIASGSDRAGRTAVIVALDSGEAALYADVGPGIAEEVYLRDRGIVTMVPQALVVGYR